MKSVFLTFALFLVVFGLLKLNIAEVLGSSWLPIVAIIVFLTVVITAISVIGLPTKKDFLRALRIKAKEADNEKDK